MNTKNSLWSVVLAGTMLLTACDNDDDITDDGRSLNNNDKEFVENVSMSNITQIRMGQLAATNGENEMVREYGQRMVEDHTAAQADLNDIADDYNNVMIATEPNDEDQAIIESLNGMSGYSFDSMYVAEQIAHHEMAIPMFQESADNAEESEVKAYATEYLPIIETHRDNAVTLRDALMPEDDNTDN